MSLGLSARLGRLLTMPSPATRPKISLLVTDLDNTLWDWFHAWHAQFTPLLDELESFTALDREQLEQEIRTVHQRRGTTEYSWLIYELPSVLKVCGDRDPKIVLDKALHRQNSARLRETRLYDGVLDTLMSIKAAGVPIVAYTESQSYWTKWRLNKLGLDGVLDTLYSSPDHDAPAGLDPAEKRYNPGQDYALKLTAHHHVHGGITKPNPEILYDILSEYPVPKQEVVYVGDSLIKDVAMGQAVGVIDVHAKYGETHGKDEYEQLRRVSHWTQQDVERERLTKPHWTPIASHTLTKGFYEILEKFSF